MRILALSIALMSSVSVLGFSESSIQNAKKQMIQYSIEQYSGSCPCPYSVTRSGRKCGKRSAYSKPGGADPYCFKSDITKAKAIKFLMQK